MYQTIRTLAQAWCDRLNEKELARRVEVNAQHRAQYGRDLYPAGTQYATFSLDKPGRKFTRVVMDTGSKSVHAFFDNATGDVLMAAGWGAPAKGARYNLLDEDSFATLLSRCDFAGGYLYKDRCAA